MASILLVEDNHALRDLLGEALEEAGHSVRLAANGTGGIKMLSQESPDILVTDIIMPEIEGMEMIRVVKSQCPATKVVAISGGSSRGTVDYLDVARKLGADQVLAKPFHEDVLLDTVRDLTAVKLGGCGPAGDTTPEMAP